MQTSRIRLNVPVYRGDPFILPRYDMSSPPLHQVVGQAFPRSSTGTALFRAVAVTAKEALAIRERGLLSGFSRQEKASPRSQLAPEAAREYRVVEYVNGAWPSSDFSLPIPPHDRRWADWPRDSTMVGLYSAPLKAISVGTAVGFHRILHHKAAVHLYEVSVGGLDLLDVSSVFASIGVAPRFPVEGECCVEFGIPRDLIRETLCLSPKLQMVSKEPDLLKDLYVAHMTTLTGWGFS